MNQKQLEALIYLSRNGNFNKAAEMLYFESDEDEYVTPETLQYRIKKLENDIGITLYQRAPGKSQINLTREGELFVREALTLYDGYENLKSMFSATRQNELVFTATELVILHRLVEPIRAFKRLHPKSRLEVRSNGPVEIENQVLSGQVDFGFATHLPDVKHKDLQYILWRKSRLIAVAPKAHPLAQKKSVLLEELVEYPLILLIHDFSQRDDRASIDMAFRRKKLTNKRNIVMEATNSEIICCYVEAGLGVGIVSETALEHSNRNLARIEIEPSLGSSEVGLLIRKGKLIPPMMKDFLRCVSDKLVTSIETESDNA